MRILTSRIFQYNFAFSRDTSISHTALKIGQFCNASRFLVVYFTRTCQENCYLWAWGQDSNILLRFSDTDFLKGMNILKSKHFPVFQSILHCVFAEIAVFLFPVRNLLPPWLSKTSISFSYKRSKFWRFSDFMSFWPYFCFICTQSATYKPPVKILIPRFESMTPSSFYRTVFWRVQYVVSQG